jgi:ubiquinone/menaquinone biosynthesis C-methylase UbiE
MQLNEYQLMYQVEDQHWWFKAKRLFIKVYLNYLPPNQKQKILDIGCGTGRNLKMLASYGQSQGIDYSTQAVKYCHLRGLTKTKKAGFPKLPFNGNSFSLITLFDVLYHQGIKDDLQALKEAYRILKPKGLLLITDCAHQFLYGPHDKAMHARQRYSKKELEQKLRISGFKIKKASYIYLTTFPFFLTSRLLAKFLTRSTGSDVSKPHGLINKILISLLTIESNLLKVVNLPFGSSIIILAQK